jgi:pimeloyl-ACP methyl ester carboxylesterase
MITCESVVELQIKKLSSLDGAAVIGFSMGGMVAMEIARRAPDPIPVTD